ncbi:MAG: NUDIX hydrolase [Actinomycetota bacterium]|nr:NUDIX hydrolase [Actinomycetota bacterium]
MAAVTAEQRDGVVQAAGGVVWRRRLPQGTEVLIVHRPKYDDWSFPKGKLSEGEAHADAALREVCEETGLRCALGPEVATSTYEDAQGRPKVVRYWAMEADDGEFQPNREVDQARWVSIDEAPALLTYDRDRAVLASLPR